MEGTDRLVAVGDASLIKLAGTIASRLRHPARRPNTQLPRRAADTGERWPVLFPASIADRGMVLSCLVSKQNDVCSAVSVLWIET